MTAGAGQTQTCNDVFDLLLGKWLPHSLQQELDVEQDDLSKVRRGLESPSNRLQKIKTHQLPVHKDAFVKELLAFSSGN